LRQDSEQRRWPPSVFGDGFRTVLITGFSRVPGAQNGICSVENDSGVVASTPVRLQRKTVDLWEGFVAWQDSQILRGKNALCNALCAQAGHAAGDK